MHNMLSKSQIPRGWKQKKLGDICTMFSGGTPSVDTLEYYGGAIPFIRSAEINSDKTERFLTDEGMASSSAKLVNAGDLLYALYGATSGEVGIARLFGAINQAILCIRSEISNIKFIYYVLQSRKNSILNKYLQGGQGNLSAQIIKALPIVLPPLTEQEKIAQILATWDTAIEQQANLIAEKQKQKKALMQRLLTMQQRLPGFNKPWENVKLGDVCSINKGKQLSRIDMLEAGYPVYNGGISESGYTNTFNTDADTIIISEGGNSCGFVNFIKTQFWAGGHCYVLFEIQPNKNFFYQLLKFYEQNIMKLRVGSGLPNIQTSSLKNLKLFCPIDISEQRAIADILMTADAEIDLLKRQLDAITEQKHGLMQKLLTGQIRVKVDKK